MRKYLSKSLYDKLDLSNGSVIDIQKGIDSQSLIITAKKQRQLKSFFKGYEGPKLKKVDLGEPESEEVW